MSTYPIQFESDYSEPRSRLTTFFRFFMAFPHMIVLALYGIAAYVLVIVAWFALAFTGRWPGGMYAFVANFMRYATQVYGYMFLLTDAYPPFGGGDDYPVRLHTDPPLPEYNRLKVLLRIFYIIPAYVIQLVIFIVAELVAFVSWLVILFTGKQPKALQDIIAMGMSYWVRSSGLFVLLTETYPPIQDEPQRLPAGPGSATELVG